MNGVTIQFTQTHLSRYNNYGSKHIHSTLKHSINDNAHSFTIYVFTAKAEHGRLKQVLGNSRNDVP